MSPGRGSVGGGRIGRSDKICQGGVRIMTPGRCAHHDEFHRKNIQLYIRGRQ